MRLRIAGVVAVVVAALAGPGIAAATTPAQVAERTMTLFNRKLAFAHSTARVQGVRCLRETSSFFYCRGKVVDAAHGISIPAAWNVTIRPDGTGVWEKE